MHREKRGKNHALVYSSRKKGRHLRRSYMTGRKREKTCMKWQVGDLFNLKIIIVYYTANIFCIEKWVGQRMSHRPQRVKVTNSDG
jgi:hypothetical protein